MKVLPGKIQEIKIKTGKPRFLLFFSLGGSCWIKNKIMQNIIRKNGD
jgi:hypothetical protein